MSPFGKSFDKAQRHYDNMVPEEPPYSCLDQHECPQGEIKMMLQPIISLWCSECECLVKECDLSKEQKENLI